MIDKASFKEERISARQESKLSVKITKEKSAAETALSGAVRMPYGPSGGMNSR
jgi:hypothetical protein